MRHPGQFAGGIRKTRFFDLRRAVPGRTVIFGGHRPAKMVDIWNSHIADVDVEKDMDAFFNTRLVCLSSQERRNIQEFFL